jgi:prolyl-tRNA editing enzyme YbaK/EbsC (Cys-tRNA(Pro) deacylase)
MYLADYIKNITRFPEAVFGNNLYNRYMTKSPLRIVQKTLDENGINCEVFACDPDFADTAAFCEKYGFSEQQSANTIILASRKVEPITYAVFVVLATTKLDVNKKAKNLMDVRKVSFADSEATVNLTNMMVGGVTAIGIIDLPIYVDSAVMKQDKVVMGGGNRSTKIVVDPNELLKLPNVGVIEGLALEKVAA